MAIELANVESLLGKQQTECENESKKVNGETSAAKGLHAFEPLRWFLLPEDTEKAFSNSSSLISSSCK